MKDKKEIIEVLKNLRFLEDSEFRKIQQSSELEEFDFCIKIFKKWCNLLEVPVNYNSFYEFLLDHDDEGVSISEDNNRLTFSKGSNQFIMSVKTKRFYTGGLQIRIKQSPYYHLYAEVN